MSERSVTAPLAESSQYSGLDHQTLEELSVTPEIAELNRLASDLLDGVEPSISNGVEIATIGSPFYPATEVPVFQGVRLTRTITPPTAEAGFVTLYRLTHYVPHGRLDDRVVTALEWQAGSQQVTTVRYKLDSGDPINEDIRSEPEMLALLHEGKLVSDQADKQTAKAYREGRISDINDLNERKAVRLRVKAEFEYEGNSAAAMAKQRLEQQFVLPITYKPEPGSAVSAIQGRERKVAEKYARIRRNLASANGDGIGRLWLND